MSASEDAVAMQKEGRSEEEIVITLTNKGYPANEISEAVNQTKIKSAIMEPIESSPAPSQTFSPNQPITREQEEYASPQPAQVSYPAPEQYQYPQQQGYGNPYQDYSAQAQTSPYSSDTMTEIAEQVMSDKFSALKTELEKIIDFRSTILSKVDYLDERLKRLEKIIDRLQLSVLQKVGDYINNIDEIKKEIGETQKSFKSLLDNKSSAKPSSSRPSPSPREEISE